MMFRQKKPNKKKKKKPTKKKKKKKKKPTKKQNYMMKGTRDDTIFILCIFILIFEGFQLIFPNNSNKVYREK